MPPGLLSPPWKVEQPSIFKLRSLAISASNESYVGIFLRLLKY